MDSKRRKTERKKERQKCMSFLHFVVSLVTGPLPLAKRVLKSRLFQFPVSSRFLKVTQYLITSADTNLMLQIV